MDLLNAIIALSNYVLIPGIAYGSQLALGALGVTLVYGILRFSNFAHGDTMAMGTMATILITWLFQSMGLSLGVLPTALLALPFGIAFAMLLVLGTDRVVYKFYREQKAKPVILVIVSLGVTFIYNGITRFIIGADDQNFLDGQRFIMSARDFKEMTGLREGLAFKTTQGITIIAIAPNTIRVGSRIDSTLSAKRCASLCPSTMRRLNSGTKALAKAPSANSRRKMLGSMNASCQASPIGVAPSTRATRMSRTKPNTRLTAVSPPIVPTFLSRLTRQRPCRGSAPYASPAGGTAPSPCCCSCARAASCCW